jgi:RNA polymerase sigma factor (sigma-70 family)
MAELLPLSVLRRLRRMVGPPEADEIGDGRLLERFIAVRDEVAFETLLQRHGPMVLGVCRRLLRDPHQIEDVFQATFLVLVRKASAIARRDSVGSWLHGVARHIALRARADSARRPFLLPEGTDVAQRPDRRSDVQDVIDEEVQRLPEKYRAPVVLCYLEGKTNEEAARQLGCPAGTIFTRLARGRELLRTRLLRRGVALSTVLASGVLIENASAAVPAALHGATLEAATLAAAGKTAGSATVLALVEEATRAFSVSRWKIAVTVLLTLASASLVLAAVYPAIRPAPKHEFPRRLLAIHVGQHVFAETVQPGPEKQDIRALAQTLAQRLQIPANQTLVLDEGDKDRLPLVKPLLEKTIADYLDSSREQDRIVLLFVGHATAIKGKAYLVPFEGELHTPESLIAIDWLYERLAKCSARQKVLILDVCRYDSSREHHRPGGTSMTRELDGALRAAPDGVEVWLACSQGQNSCTSAGFAGSVFLEQLQAALRDGEQQIPLGAESADDPIPVDRLAAGTRERPGVNELTEQEARRRFKATQTPRLIGAATPSLKRFDPKLPAAVMPALDRAAARKPLLATAYRATLALDKNELSVAHTFHGDRMQMNRDVSKVQKALAVSQLEVQEMLEDFEALKKARNDENAGPTAQAYDYTNARLQARFASTFECNWALGDVRKEDLPAPKPGHTGWRLVPQDQLRSTGDEGKRAKLAARKASEIVDELQSSYKGTPWKQMAERDRLYNLGLNWESIP